MNAKDAPFAVAMAILLLGLVRAFERISARRRSRRARWSASASACRSAHASWAAFGAVDALAALAADPGDRSARARASGTRHASAGGSCSSLVAGDAARLCGDGAGLALVGDRPAQSVCARSNISRTSSRSRGRSCSAARLISVPDMPRSYVPTLLALKLPEIFLAARRSAARPAPWSPRRGATLRAEPARGPARWSRSPPCCRSRSRSRCGRPCTTASGISCSCCRRSRCSAASPAPGCSTAASRLVALRRCRGRAFWSAGIALPVVDMARLHPYEYTHFNRLAGGVRARARPLHARLLGARRSSRLRRRCSPSSPSGTRASPPAAAGRSRSAARIRSPQVELGPRFRDHLGPAGRRLRHDARRVLLRQARCAGPGRDRARRRRLCAASTISAGARSRACSPSAGPQAGL